ncbi:hypothetical protein BKH42_03595 [Helicobacter sp. 13S00482-2]|uniref:hypothetical protein n=1 Tax=Helicobacter sp. 13S00482-2 TaxID=1476200 RepID=UPI000BA6872A|nr:hypothetical protein [Helicobacter sp. 13S00482-2]PAF53825.1 hypothetical protein BKH42_03595 [Helicobacter sp. 13S00482-2]
MFNQKNTKTHCVDEQKIHTSKNNKILILIVVLGVFVVGLFFGKVIFKTDVMEYKKQISDLSSRILILEEAQKNSKENAIKLQGLVYELNGSKKELANAFQKAISIQEAINAINRKAEMVKGNAERIKRNYINDNLEVKNLDYSVIKELLKVVDDDTSKQLSVLNHSVEILSDFQKKESLPISGKAQNKEIENQKFNTTVGSEIDKKEHFNQNNSDFQDKTIELQ